ncbi:amidohydrolase family protein [Chloroflexota bacterium]
MIIDAHTHGMHGGYLDSISKAGGKWGEKKVEFALAQAKRKPSFTDVNVRLEQLDRTGIDYQAVTAQWTFDSNLLPGEVKTQLAYAQALNDNIARLMEDSKGRLLGIGTVPLSDFENYGKKEMERAINNLGMKAVAVSTNLQGKPIDLPEYEPFWAHAEAMDVAVFIHPADAPTNVGRPYEDEYDLMHNFGWPFESMLTLSRLVFSGIMERYPKLKVVGHHLGGGIPFFFGRTMETYTAATNVNWKEPSDKSHEQLLKKIGHDLSKPMYDYFAQFYYDTAIGGSAPAIKCAYDVFGVDRLIFATDAPFGPGTGEERMASYPDVVRSVGLTDEENQKIFADNARKMLNMD